MVYTGKIGVLPESTADWKYPDVVTHTPGCLPVFEEYISNPAYRAMIEEFDEFKKTVAATGEWNGVKVGEDQTLVFGEYPDSMRIMKMDESGGAKTYQGRWSEDIPIERRDGLWLLHRYENRISECFDSTINKESETPRGYTGNNVRDFIENGTKGSFYGDEFSMVPDVVAVIKNSHNGVRGVEIWSHTKEGTYEFSGVMKLPKHLTQYTTKLQNVISEEMFERDYHSDLRIIEPVRKRDLKNFMNPPSAAGEEATEAKKSTDIEGL